jgi:diguanylate cyclase (GGDEF)-like protein/PAS domain S-box-containing protein
MAGLYDVGLAVTSALELDKTLRVIYEQVNHLMSLDTFYIALYDEARGELRFDIFVEEGEWLPKFTKKLDEGGLTTWIVQSKKPLFIGNFEKESPPVAPGQVGKPETQSWLGFPLLVRDKVVGVISVQSFRSHAFTEGNKRTLSAFANQAAIAIENARLYEETRQRALEQETLREAALALTTTLDRNEVIDRILIQLQQVVPYDSASVQLLQGDRLVIIGGHGFPSLDELLGISFPTDGDNPNREVMRTRASFIVEDAPVVYEAFREDPHRQIAICSWLGVPMLIGEQLVGMIALDKREPGFYTQEHARLAEAFAAQGAIAIENARLFEETRRRALQLQTIEEIGRRVSAILNPDELLPYVARAIQRSFGYYHVDIFLVDTATSYVVFKASSDPARKKAWKEQGLRFKIGEEGITGWVAHTGEPLLVNDVSQEPRYLPDELLPETKSELVVPLKVGERVVGVLDVASNELNAFAEDNLFVLQTLSNQIAIAIENARLFQETEERRVYLEGVLGAAPDAIVTLDAHHRVVEWNAGAEKLFGYSPEEVIGKDTDDLITSPDVLEEAVGFTQIGLSGREMPPTEVVRYRKDGSPVDVLLAGSPILVGDELIGTVVVYTDITEQVRAEREIEERRVYLEGVLREAPDAIVTLDAHHRIVEWNTGAERLFGYSRGETIGRDLDPLITNPDVFEEAIGFTQMALGGKALPPTETVRYRKDGSPVDVLVAASPIMVGDELIGIVAIYTDITARVRMEETLRALALMDDLTSLYNRRGFVTLGQQQLKAADRTKRRMVLLFADFDGLKQINDTFGHSEGDRALIETADVFRETFRESDIIARIGGDEFVVLAIETNGSPAEVLATRFQENLKARNAREDRHYKLSLSVGLARYDPEYPCSIDELLAQADRAMYEQKRGDTSG